ncbi:MAG: phage tail protein [Acidimicrobiales bacterium]|nr:phage tail protein [Actinomycetota bacterium]
MATKSGRESDPLIGFTFSLDLGTLKAFFTEVSGIGSENEVVEHKVVDEKGHELIQKIPGRLTWEDISLKRGITDTMDLWEWRKQVEEGKLKDARRNGSVVMYDRNYEEVARWDFLNAWPSKVSGPSLDASSTDIGVEEVTIVHEGIKRVT